MCCAIALQLEKFLSVAVGVTSRAHACLNNHEGPSLTLGASHVVLIGKHIKNQWFSSKYSTEYGNSYAVTCNETLTNTEHVTQVPLKCLPPPK